MKLKYLYILILLCAFSFQSCQDGYEQYDGVYVSGTLTNNPVIPLTVDEVFPKKVDLTIASSTLVNQAVVVEMKTDSTLVGSYNKKFSTSYYALPKNCYVLSHPTVTIEDGDYATKTPVTLNIISTEGMVSGRKYMVPVTITKVSGGYPVIEASRSVYVVLNQVIVGPALNLNGSKVVTIDFMQANTNDSGINPFDMSEFSFEARIFMYSYGQFNTIMGLEENIILRTSTYGGAGGRLEMCGDGMAIISSPGAFPLNAWTHVACTYNAATTVAAMYINGEQVGSLAVSRKNKNICLKGAYEGSGQNPDFPFKIGYSAGSRYINAAVSEARIWAKTLTGAEIKNNMCAVDPSDSKLLGYWKFNEGTATTTFADLTGNGFEATSTSPTWVQGVRCPEN